MSSMSTPEEYPHAAVSTQLLSHIAPELSLSWILSEASEKYPQRMPPILYRGLISYMLRAASQHDARAASDALHASLRTSQRNAAACLGFTSEMDLQRAALIILDILQSASRAHPLLQTSNALSFYSTAGPGAADADEFHSEDLDSRIPFCEEYEKLPSVRAYNLMLCVQYLTASLSDKSTYLFIQDIAHKGMSQFLNPLVSSLPESISELDPKMTKAVQQFYCTYMKQQPQSIRDDLKTRLVNSVMRVGIVNQDFIGTYLDGLDDCDIRFSVSRQCLIQRFKVNDKLIQPLTIEKLLKAYFNLKPVQGRTNKIVPALLSSLIVSWYETAPETTFKYRESRAKAENRILEVLHSLRKLKNSLPSTFGASKRDRTAFRVAIMILVNRIIEANGKLFDDSMQIA